MLRVLMTIVLPLILPTAVYLLWLRLTQPREGEIRSPWPALPWPWLAGFGVALLAVVLFVVNIHFGTPQEGVYVPPRYENGRILPGHVDPDAR